MERLISYAGDICTPDHFQLTADKIYMLDDLQLVSARAFDSGHARTFKVSTRLLRFAKLTMTIRAISTTKTGQLIRTAEVMRTLTICFFLLP